MRNPTWCWPYAEKNCRAWKVRKYKFSVCIVEDLWFSLKHSACLFCLVWRVTRREPFILFCKQLNNCRLLYLLLIQNMVTVSLFIQHSRDVFMGFCLELREGHSLSEVLIAFLYANCHHVWCSFEGCLHGKELPSWWIHMTIAAGRKLLGTFLFRDASALLTLDNE